ncbi:hypothetical protein SK128_018724, partial [Halocaridina rubra]
MATMQGYMNGQDSQLDELPSWKRDLILRKRANVRMVGGFGLPTPTPSMAGRGLSSLSGVALSSSSMSGGSSSMSGPIPSSGRGPFMQSIRSVSGPSSSHPHPSNINATSPRLEGDRGSTVRGDGNFVQKCAVKSEISSANVSTSMHHKGLNDEGPRVTSPSYSSYSDSCTNHGSVGDNDEDFSYGPGIVSKLKNRYMSLAMRESRSRPSLRKFSSLEDLLDDPRETWPERNTSVNVARPHHGGHQHHTQANAASYHHRREVMKRARSVDSLSSRLSEETRTRGLPKSKSATSRLQSSLSALQKDDVIIIEANRPTADLPPSPQQVNGVTKTFDAGGQPPPLTRKMSSSSLADEDEMPPPDTVRHVKSMFERTSMAPRGTKARVAAHKAAQAAHNNKISNGVSPTVKPAIMAKPTGIPSRKVTPPSPPFPVTIEKAKSSLKQVAQVSRASPRITLSVPATPVNGDIVDSGESGRNINSGLGIGGMARPGMTPVTASVTAPLVNGGGDVVESKNTTAVEVKEGIRKVSNTAVTNIRKESHSQEFNFTRSSTSQGHQLHSTPIKASSPTPSPLPASPVVSHRELPTIPSPQNFSTTTSPSSFSSPSPFAKIERSQESDRVQQENLKNAEKSRSGGADVTPKFDPVKVTKVEPNNKSPSKVESPVKPPTKVEPHRSHPIQRLKETSAKDSPAKPEYTPIVPVSPVEPKASFGSDDLVRSQGKGNLVEAFNKQSAEVNSPVHKPANRDWRNQRAPESNTLVFNFTSSTKETPDYIENDGIDLSKRRPE